MSYLLLTQTDNELYHHGIKGMKWGIRRFQPYQSGARVKGGKEVGLATKVKQRVTGIGDGIKQHKVKKQRAQSLKKAQATRKANLENEAAKKKAIESGSIEDLAKFKGQLSNEDYAKAFQRLQNEQKMATMVAANQKSFLDKVDKGMALVQKFAGYANTVATFKENTDRMVDALNKKKDEDEKEAKEKKKNEFMNNATFEELQRDHGKYGLTTDDYNKVVKRLSSVEAFKKVAGLDNDNKQTSESSKAEPPKTEAPKQEKKGPGDIAKNAAYDNSNPKDFERPARTLSEKARYVNPDGTGADLSKLKFNGQTTVNSDGSKSYESSSNLKAKNDAQPKGYKGTPDDKVANSVQPTTQLKTAAPTTKLSAVKTTTLNTGKETTTELRKRSYESLTREQKDQLIREGAAMMGITSSRPTSDNPSGYNWDEIKSNNKKALNEAYKRSLR